MTFRRQEGSILIVSLFGLLVLVVFMAYLANASFLIAAKVQLQNSVDASAFSGAIWQARGLNILSALNTGLIEIDETYRLALAAWIAAVVADDEVPEGPAQEAWRIAYQRKLTAICSPRYLDRIRCTQRHIVSRFNRLDPDSSCQTGSWPDSNENIVVEEAEQIGKENLYPIETSGSEGRGFSPLAMNFHQGTGAPGLSVEPLPETSRHLSGAGSNAISAGIRCDIPPRWGLKGDFGRTQYVLSSATAPESTVLIWPQYFGSGDKIYAISKARPVRPDMKSLDLNSSDWEGRLVPVTNGSDEDDAFERFRRTREGKSLGFQQVPTRPLIH